MRTLMVLVGIVSAVATAASGTVFGADNFVVPYVPSSPTIDGIPGEWSQASQSTVTLVENDGSGNSHNSTLYFEHDGTNLYVGVDSGLPTNFGDTWDFYWGLGFDGNDDGLIDGSLTAPYTDVSIECQSPYAWPGENQFRINTSSEVDQAGIVQIPDPAGVNRGVGGSSSDVTWEFQIPLSVLGTSPGDWIGFVAWHGNVGNFDTDYTYPAGQMAQPENWTQLYLAPTPEPSTIVLLGVGAVSLLAYAWRKRRAA